MKISHQIISIAALALVFAAPGALADNQATLVLTKSVTLSSGASVEVENLVGHMIVTQGSGPLQVTALVVATGGQAQRLIRTVKLEVHTADNHITVHIHYPVGQYDSYTYIPTLSSTYVDHHCLFGVLCVRNHWAINNSWLVYRGARVHVSDLFSPGVPLHVDVTIRLPAGVRTTLSNLVGPLDADNLTNQLTLNSARGDLHIHNLSGDLAVHTKGGDLYVKGLKGTLISDTDGGDMFINQAIGEIDLVTDGGDIFIKQVLGDMSMQSDGGKIFVKQSRGDMDLDTHGGDFLATDYAGGSKLMIHTGGGDVLLTADLSGVRSLGISTGGGDALLKISNLSMRLDISSGSGDTRVNLPNTTNVVANNHGFLGDVGKAMGSGTVSSDGGYVQVSGP